ncbi:MAG: chromophore lyase CpcT/CpeT [Bradymonadia bacterium]
MNHPTAAALLLLTAVTTHVGCDDDDTSSTNMPDAAQAAESDASIDASLPEPDAMMMPDADLPDMAPPAPTDVELAADWLTGDFNSRAQAMADRRYFDVHLYAIQIWPDREDGAWMYVQQSRDDNDDGTYEAPYRQRVYWVHGEGDGVVSTVYRIEDEDQFVDPWNDLSVLDALSEESLTLAEGCDVRLTRMGETFVGGTEGTACRLSFGGYATSAVTLSETGLRSLDLLYDDGGNIINGLTEDSTPYTFDKLENFPLAQ